MVWSKYDSVDEYTDEYEEYQNENDDDNDAYDDDDEFTYNGNDEDLHEELPVTQWRRIKLGQALLDVSDKGTIKPHRSLFEASCGYAYIGTPYRTYTVEIEKGVHKEYFVHDIVWRAFNGDPPSGWEVRHTFEESCRRRKYYSNALKHLIVGQATVEHAPVLFPAS